MGGLALHPRTFWQPIRGRWLPWATVCWTGGQRLELRTRFVAGNGHRMELAALGATTLEAAGALTRVVAAYL